PPPAICAHDVPRRPASMTFFASWSGRSRPQRRRATLLLPRRQGRPYCLLGRSRQAGDDESSGGRVPCTGGRYRMSNRAWSLRFYMGTMVGDKYLCVVAKIMGEEASCSPPISLIE